MRWVDITERLPREVDADGRENVLTRYFIGANVYFELEDYIHVGGAWTHFARCEWLDTITQPPPKETTHIRKVEL